MPVQPRRKILIVEDDPSQRELLSRYLAGDGFQVETHGSPIGSVNLARRFAPDVVLVDLELPAFEGQRVIALMRQHGIVARYFVWSSADESRVRTAANSVQADWFLKSTPLDRISTTLRTIALCTREVRPTNDTTNQKRADDHRIFLARGVRRAGNGGRPGERDGER